MKKPLISIVHENAALARLHAVLPSLGFEVRAFESLSDFISSAGKISSAAIILDSRLAEAFARSTASVKFLPQNENPLVIFIAKEGRGRSDNTSRVFFELPNDLLILYRFLQENLPILGRDHLRMRIRLPGIYCKGEGCHFAEIMSLGTGGGFIRTGWNRLEKDALIKIGIPLLGMNKELEIESRVVYHIEPSEENNYLQGVGVRFTRLESEAVRIVGEYIRHYLQEELSESRCVRFNFPVPEFVPPRINRFSSETGLILRF